MNLKELRKEYGLSQKDIANLAKEVDPRIDVSLISKIENGLCDLTPTVSAFILSHLQGDLSHSDELIEETYKEQTGMALSPKFADVINMLQIGKENAITRSEIRMRTGLLDRDVRKIISDARKEGWMIANSGKGYYIADNYDDLYAYYRREKSRGINVFVALKNIRSELKTAGYEV